REFRAWYKAQRAIKIDRAPVRALDMNQRRLALAQHSIDDPADQRPRVPASLHIRMRAYGADLAQIVDPQPLARHRGQSPRQTNADIRSELDGARSKRPRLGEVDQLKHFRNVLRAENRRIEITLRQRLPIAAEHLGDTRFIQNFPMSRKLRQQP